MFKLWLILFSLQQEFVRFILEKNALDQSNNFFEGKGFDPGSHET